MDRKMLNHELILCPFCGGEAEFIECDDPYWIPTFNDPDSGGYLHHTIICKACRASIDVFTTKQEAISAWNTRYEIKEQK